MISNQSSQTYSQCHCSFFLFPRRSCFHEHLPDRDFQAHSEPVGRVISQIFCPRTAISAIRRAPANPMVPLRPVKNYSARGHVNAVLTESTFLSHRLVHHHHSQQTVEPSLESLNAQSLRPPHRQPHTCSACSPHRPSSIRSRPQAYCTVSS